VILKFIYYKFPSNFSNVKISTENIFIDKFDGNLQFSIYLVISFLISSHSNIISDEYEISKLPEEVQIEIAKDLSIKEDIIYRMEDEEKLKIAKTLSTHLS
jgi:hypothetical protein